jgi:hypothetical protein
MIRLRRLLPLALVSATLPLLSEQAPDQHCRIAAVNFRGWSSQQLSNKWITLTFVPELGGRVMQFEFDGHPYLFINPKFVGKYISPEQAAGKWINYGGDKLWPMPEGNEDEHHWVLESDALDDGPYIFKTVSEGETCTVELDGAIDDKTGLQYSRLVSIDSKSPAVHFHATIRNATSHELQWSVQSVTQYDLANAKTPGTFNKNFWAYTAIRSDSAYMNGFHVRSGLADDPSFSVRDGLFRLHWLYLSNEVWIDSTAGWLAVADGETRYAMIERFHFDPAATYPDKATVIFYKNGPSVEFDETGLPEISKSSQHSEPYYMEAEINSPLVRLDPGATYSFDTVWFPLRATADVQRVTEAGIVTSRLEATSHSQHLHLKASFGVVVSGHLQIRIFDKSGRDVKHILLDAVRPRDRVTLDRDVYIDSTLSRVSLHLLDDSGADWGVIDEATVKSNQ